MVGSWVVMVVVERMETDMHVLVLIAVVDVVDVELDRGGRRPPVRVDGRGWRRVWVVLHALLLFVVVLRLVVAEGRLLLLEVVFVHLVHHLAPVELRKSVLLGVLGLLGGRFVVAVPRRPGAGPVLDRAEVHVSGLWRVPGGQGVRPVGKVLVLVHILVVIVTAGPGGQDVHGRLVGRGRRGVVTEVVLVVVGVLLGVPLRRLQLEVGGGDERRVEVAALLCQRLPLLLLELGRSVAGESRVEVAVVHLHQPVDGVHVHAARCRQQSRFLPRSSECYWSAAVEDSVEDGDDVSAGAAGPPLPPETPPGSTPDAPMGPPAATASGTCPGPGSGPGADELTTATSTIGTVGTAASGGAGGAPAAGNAVVVAAGGSGGAGVAGDVVGGAEDGVRDGAAGGVQDEGPAFAVSGAASGGAGDRDAGVNEGGSGGEFESTPGGVTEGDAAAPTAPTAAGGKPGPELVMPVVGNPAAVGDEAGVPPGPACDPGGGGGIAPAAAPGTGGGESSPTTGAADPPPTAAAAVELDIRKE
ncbi:Galectin-3 [Frankliniella fusca]|uniref:Galectin-3 n=1 Tax=Frankliniella fusca TaxID=407009 RepID=A0AAE1GR80_9NEOP|nr:Galectin-3 [Frankliniella fusca]